MPKKKRGIAAAAADKSTRFKEMKFTQQGINHIAARAAGGEPLSEREQLRARALGIRIKPTAKGIAGAARKRSKTRKK